MLHKYFRRMSIKKTDAEWRTVLSPDAFRVLREQGTEAPGSSPLNKQYKSGTYNCAGCSTPLYTSATKFDSGCGWPAFYDSIPGAIKRIPDRDGHRIEIRCNTCDGHMGHVFKGERFNNPIDERHCVNGISLSFSEEIKK